MKISSNQVLSAIAISPLGFVLKSDENYELLNIENTFNRGKAFKYFFEKTKEILGF